MVVQWYKGFKCDSKTFLARTLGAGFAIYCNEEIQDISFGHVMFETPGRYPSGIVE